MTFSLNSIIAPKNRNSSALIGLRASTALAAALLIAAPAQAQILSPFNNPLVIPAPAQAQIAPPFNNPLICNSTDGTTVSCTGDITDGIAIHNPNHGTAFTTLNITNADDIAPADGVHGIFFRSTTGAITITGDSDGFDIDVTNANGIHAWIDGFDVSIEHVGDITTDGTHIWQSAGIYARAQNGGNVTVTHTGDITSLGGAGILGSSISAGDVSITQYGNITSAHDGIWVFNRSAGDDSSTVINMVGDITVTGDEEWIAAIGAESYNGDITITHVGNINNQSTSDYYTTGIIAYGVGTSPGTFTITHTGSIATAGTNGIEVRSEAGTHDSIINLGAEATALDGSVITGTTITAAQHGIFFDAGTDNVLNIYNEVTITGGEGFSAIHGTTGNEVINNYGHLTALGIIDLGAGDDQFNNIGTFTGGTVRLGTGDDKLDNSGDFTGTVDFRGTGVALVDEEGEPTGEVQYGIALVDEDGEPTGEYLFGNEQLTNTGTFTGIVLFGAGDDVFTNSGLFNAADSDFGDGTDLFTNTGVTRVTGVVTFAGLERFQNDGTIDMANGVTGDQLILPGTYRAAGVLAIDVNFDGTGSADILTVGGAATGSTELVINDIGTSPNFGIDVLIVDAGAGSEADAFNVPVISGYGPVISGFLAYDVFYDEGSNNFYLSNTVGAPVFRTLKIMEGAQSLWYRSADAWGAHMITLRDAPSGTSQLWLELHGAKANRDRDFVFSANDVDQTIDLGYDQNSGGFQMGYDLGINQNTIVGLTGGHINSRLEFDASPDRVRYAAWNFGAYAGYQADGFYANALFKYDSVSANVRAAPSGYNANLDGKVYGLRGEAGYRWETASLSIEPVASIEYQQASLDDIAAMGATIDFDNWDGLRGMAGLRVGRETETTGGIVLAIYSSARVVHEFAGDGNLLFTSGTSNYRLTNNPIGTYARFNIGANMVTNDTTTFFIGGTADIGGDYHSIGGRAGFRIRL